MPMTMTSDEQDVFKDEAFTGGFVPRRLADQLGLMAIYHNTTRSGLLRAMLEKNLMSDVTVVTVIRAIAKRLYKRWTSMGEVNYDHYKTDVISKFKRKKLSDQFIEEILDEVDKCYAKDHGYQTE